MLNAREREREREREITNSIKKNGYEYLNKMKGIINNPMQVFCKRGCIKQKKQVFMLKQIEKFRQTDANTLTYALSSLF